MRFTRSAPLTGGGTINGDLTITGDLTVQGDGAGNYDEIVEGNLVLTSGSKLGVGIGDAIPSAPIHVSIAAQDGVSSAIETLRLEVSESFGNVDVGSNQGPAIDFYVPVDSNTSQIGGRIAVGHENGTDTDSAAKLTFTTAPDGTSLNGSPSISIASNGITTFNYDATISSYGGNLTVKSANSSDGDATLILISDAGEANEDTWKINAEGSNNNLDFINHTNTRMTIASDGNVTIAGTSTLTGNSTFSGKIYLGSSSAMHIYSEGTGSGENQVILVKTNDLKLMNQHHGGNITFHVENSSGTAAQAMTINGDANVGIGTDSPSHKLSVDGATTIYGQNAAHDVSALVLSQESSTKSQIRAYGSDGTTSGSLEIIVSASDGSPTNTVMLLDANSRMSLSNNDAGATGRTYNTIFGYLAGDDLSTGGLYNSIFGDNAGHQLETGDYNCAFGINALDGSTAADRVTAIGSAALRGALTTGDSGAQGAVGVGYGALNQLTSGSGNVAVGYQASYAITTGSWNTIIGHNAYATGTGSANNNTAIGFEAGRYLGDDGASNHSSYNTIIGRSAMGGGHTGTPAGNTAHLNIAIGHGALGGGTGTSTNLTASNNTVVGYASMNTATTGTHNTIMGYGAGQLLTSGTYSVMIGAACGDAIVDSGSHVLIGTGAGGNGDIANDGQVAVGHVALHSLTNGQRNTALGYSSLNLLTEGDNNIAIGYQAMDAVAVGESDNIAIGYGAMGAMDEGTGGGDIDYNIAIGTNALLGADLTSNNRQVQKNIAIGANALDATSNGEMIGAVAIGYSALSACAAAEGNTAVGHESLLLLTNGQWNTAIGFRALDELASGSKNTAVGYMALHQIDGGETNNTAIGYQAGANADGNGEGTFVGANTSLGTATDNDNVIIGESATGGGANSIVIGADATGQSANSVTLGNASVTDVYMAQDSQAYIHSQNVPNHVANTMSSPYYRFDGADDIITIADNDNLTFTNGFTFSAWVYIEKKEYFPILTKGKYNSNWEHTLRTSGDGKIELFIANGSTGFYTITGTNVLSENKWIHLAVTYDGNTSPSTGNFTFYVNGSTETVASASLSNSFSGIPNSGGDVLIGNYDSQYAEGQIASIQMYNHVLDATEVKELYSGASVPFKYKGANQTSLNSASLQANSTYGMTSVSSASATGITASSDGTNLDAVGTTDSLVFVKGKRYRASYTGTISSGTAPIFAIVDTENWSATKTGLTPTTLTAGSNVIEWTATESGTFVALWYLSSAAGAFVIADFSIVPIGAVAEYDGSGIASDKWLDKSGNDLHGTTSGNPSVENAPSGDDGLVYEEGTFSPLMTGITNTSWHTLAGFYKRVGNLVSFKLIIRTTTGDATNSSNVEITGLPYTSDSTSNSNGGAYITYSSDFDDDDSSSPQFNIEPNTTKIEVFKSTGARFIGTDMDSVTVLLRLNGQYYT